jgi:selT/selW/selH-like putative selenoprotein
MLLGEWTNSMNLIPGASGAFEVTVNGDLIFSKKRSERFPEIQELAETIQTYLD